MAEQKKVRRKRVRVKKEKKSYKNSILIIISFFLFLYSGFVLLYPAILTASFDENKFCKQVYKSTGLVTNVDKVEYKMKPNFDMTITVRGWVSKHIDNQNAFESKEINIVTTPFSIFTKKFNIKSTEFKGTKIWEQFLPNGANKLDYIAGAFSAKDFGANTITLKPSAVDFKSFTIIHEGPNLHEEYMRKKSYSLFEVKKFLTERNIREVIVK